MNKSEITPKYPPMTFAEFSPDWIGSHRAMIQNQAIELRGSGLHIEAIDRAMRNEWQYLTLPGGGTEFATTDDRDRVMEALGWKNQSA